LNSPKTPRIVAVLGMHRSGTSWLAGSLQELGLEMGEVSTSDPHNKKGNRESPVLMEIHEGVLADNDGSWKKPPRKSKWSDARRAALAAHVADMNARFPGGWGFKDPRALLVLDEWLRQVPTLARVGIFRHPLAVHRSLAARSDRFDEARSVELWRAYNERLIAEHDRAPFTMLRFDVPQDRLFAGLQRVAKELSLPAADKPSRFFDAELVHNEAAAEEIPRSCRKLWDRLESMVDA
jgi:hypothetical protein